MEVEEVEVVGVTVVAVVEAGEVAGNKTGVGMSVWSGPGGGMPSGYESSKMSSCAPSSKLYFTV